MNFKEAKNACKLVLNTDNLNKDGLNLTPMLWGGAGIGKTSLVKEIADELGYELRVISLNTLSPLDVRGMPYIPADNPEAFRFIPAQFVPNGNEEKPVLLFFDEINTAPPLSQVVAYQIALERNLGGHVLPVYTITLMIKGEIHEIKTTRKTAVILAGNRSEDKGATFEMPYPLANRLIHLTVDADADEFSKYALKMNFNTGIIAFIKSNPTYLHRMSKEYAFATPRSWHMLSVLLEGVEDYSSRTCRELIYATVGQGTGSLFFEFLSLNQYLPDIDDILLKGTPLKFKDTKSLEGGKIIRRDLEYYFSTAISSRLIHYSGKGELTPSIVNYFELAINGFETEIQSFILSMIIKDSGVMRELSKSASPGIMDKIEAIFKNV